MHPVHRPSTWFSTLAALTVLASSTPLAAQASLTNEFGRPVLEEARFVHQVTFDGPVALVESSQTISNPHKSEQEAIYTFDLPVRAAVTGLSVRLADGRTTAAAIVDADAAVLTIPDPDAVDAMADVGLLRLVARDRPDIDGPSPHDRATYEVRIAPVPSRKVVTTTISWITPLDFVDGRLSLRIPARGEASNLVREKVHLTLRPPNSVRGFSAIHGGGRALGKGVRKASFTAPARSDLTIEAGLDFGADAELPRLAYATVALGQDVGAIGISILNPSTAQASRLDYQRALIMVDTSRSMDSQALRAAAALADAFLTELPASAEVEVITFDRAARRVLGSFESNRPTTRKRVAKALRPGEQSNGSDLGQALELARTTLLPGLAGSGREPGRRADTLVVLISDGMVPLAIDNQVATSRIGSDVLGQIEFFPLVLVPDAALMPDLTRGTLSELAGQTSVGRAIAVRASEAEGFAENLTSGLTRPAPLSNISLEMDRDTDLIRDLDLPYGLEPGQGLFVTGIYRGAPPSKIRFSAIQRGDVISVPGQRVSQLTRHSGQLALARAGVDDFLPDGVGTSAGTSADRSTQTGARRQLVLAASKAGAVTEYSSIVALASHDRFARDRLSMVNKWGPAAFMRFPPAPEREFGAPLMRTYAERAPRESQDHEMGMRTGDLDADIIKRLLSTHVVPQARVCYEKMLRRQHDLAGQLVVVVEIARGEVQFATVERSSMANQVFDACVIEAAYAIQVPRVALGDDVETIGVVRYPLRFKRSESGTRVEAVTEHDKTIEELLQDDNPLGDLPAGGGPSKGPGKR